MVKRCQPTNACIILVVQPLVLQQCLKTSLRASSLSGLLGVGVDVVQWFTPWTRHLMQDGWSIASKGDAVRAHDCTGIVYKIVSLTWSEDTD